MASAALSTPVLKRIQLAVSEATQLTTVMAAPGGPPRVRCDVPRAFDIWTGLSGGLAAQQNANEPGGTRWLRLADDAIEKIVLLP
jgi:hypothetical protein